jgi:hypothetical protein
MGRAKDPKPSASAAAVHELNGTLWKAMPGATTTFADFVEARERFLALHKEEMWNPWAREENEAEDERVNAVMAQWTRAEPGFRPKTDEEVDAYLNRLERESAEQCEDERRLRAARIPGFDERRHQARLELLEVQSRLQYETEERDALVARTSFPAMADDRRAAAIAEAEKAIADLAERVARLEAEVGNPDTVIDQHGYLPADRQVVSLSEFRWWRERQIRELREQIATLRASTAASTDRKERANLGNELHGATRRHDSLLAVPPLDPQDMCSECTKRLRG